MGKKIKVRCLLVSRDQICSGFFKTRNLCNICLLSYCLLMSVSLFKCRNLSRIKHSPCPVIRWPLTSMSCVLLIDSAFTYMEKEGTLRLLCNLDILQIHNHHHHHQRKKKRFAAVSMFFSDFFSPSSRAHACCSVSGSWPCATSTERPEGGATVLLLGMLLDSFWTRCPARSTHTNAHAHIKAEWAMQPLDSEHKGPG